MEFEHTIDLNGSPEAAWEFFSKLENLYSWQPTLQSIEVIEGNRDTVGSVSKLIYQEKKKQIQIIEIINDMRAPEFFSSTSTDLLGTVKNYTENFFEPYNDTTIFRIRCEFNFSGFLMKLTKPFIRGHIQQQLEDDLQRFKAAFEQSLVTPKKVTLKKKAKSTKSTKKKKSKKKK